MLNRSALAWRAPVARQFSLNQPLAGAILAVALLVAQHAQALDLIFTNETTANGLGSNTVNGVYASGSTIYAGTAGGLSISTDGGSTFTNKTTANGLGATLSLAFTSVAARSLPALLVV